MTKGKIQGDFISFTFISLFYKSLIFQCKRLHRLRRAGRVGPEPPVGRGPGRVRVAVGGRVGGVAHVLQEAPAVGEGAVGVGAEA